MRVLNRLLAQVIIFGCLIASAAAKVSLAKPNCQETCGGVTIPYPFGIGKNCYLNPYFEITCNSSRHRPFLRKFNWEVLNISLDTNTDLLVNNPVYSTCRDGSSWNSSDLYGSPFTFDYTNRLVTVGCGNALMFDQIDKLVAGCTSTCRGASLNSNGCYGINCCQTTNAGLNAFKFYRLASTVNTSVCTYAFLANDLWFRKNFSTSMFTYERKAHVPVNLRWAIQSSDFPGHIERDIAYWCSYFGVTYSSGLTIAEYKCQCMDSYEGNPYIIKGCQVVAACANCNGRCEQNLKGVFICIPNRTTEIIIAGAIGGAFALVILIMSVLWIYKILKRRREIKLKMKFFKRNGGLMLQQQLSANDDSFDSTKIFTVEELEIATDSFNISRVLGQGGQGTVYKGMLTDGKIVAVKKSTLVNEGQVEQFINEVVILSQINHRNIVKLLGCCLETEVPLLVYEFISNGTLSQLIRNQEDDFPLSWEMRLQIATEVSGALAYLHSATSVPIYHRDVKSSNILLDDKYRAKVADFGTSRSVAMDKTHMTTIVQGTFGYLDPEFFRSGQFTDKSDVYSFGVVLAELLTGERPIMSRVGQEETSLATYLISALEEDFLFDIIDERVAREGSKDGVIAFAILARRCLKLNGRQRPTMKEVMLEIERIRLSSLPTLNNSNKFHNDRSFSESRKKQDGFNSTSFSDYTTRSESDDSCPLMFSG